MITPRPPYSFADLLSVMERLRAPGGCPWDREQTHASLLPYLVEEAYEFIEAAERGDAAHMREELGDVLLQVVFHAQVAREAGTFDVEGVIGDITAKLIRRHPHVFGAPEERAGVDTADKVVAQWDDIKKAEKAGSPSERKSLLDGIPRGLPALPKALKISERAVKAGFEWPDWKGVADKVREELAEFEEEASAIEAAQDKESARDAMEMELGDLLFAVVNLGRRVGLDPERALGRSNAKFTSRWRAMEAMAEEEGAPLAGRPVDALEALWQRAKRAE